VNRKETKIYDPADGFGAITDPVELTDATLAKRGLQWWMYLVGQKREDGTTEIYSASLPVGAPLATTGWSLTPDWADPTKAAPLAGHACSRPWDGNGGRHCPSYVQGWDPHSDRWVERIYYAGAADHLWGPYAIGYLEWDGAKWVDQPEPAFVAEQDWERESVYEPNIIYADGMWKLWYVAGSNAEDHLVQGYAESRDGRSAWSAHEVFIDGEQKVFDFFVTKVDEGYEAVFSRVWVAKKPAPVSTGLWWCRAELPSSKFSDWSDPVQIMSAEDRGWHSGPWRPSLHYDEIRPGQMLIFFDGIYKTDDPGPFPFAFTLGCLEMNRP
jgi:hypothetical protein